MNLEFWNPVSVFRKMCDFYYFNLKYIQHVPQPWHIFVSLYLIKTVLA